MMIDPPRFGRGPDGEIWKLQESLAELLGECGKLLDGPTGFVLLNVYTTVVTQGRTEDDAQRLRAGLQNMLKRFGATVSSGELALQDGAQRRISTSVFARAEFGSVR
jgi:23S rRNA (cytosine1962-C5)-methyltransferase